MKSDWRANASATLVGSMPHRDRNAAIELILGEVPEIPVWPQLPSFQAEQMMIQYNEGLPGQSASPGKSAIFTDTPAFEQELYAFYEEYMEVDAGSRDIIDSRFRLGPETGATFFRFLERIDRSSSALRAVKGQIVGPFTLLSGLKDQRDRLLLYDERLQDVVAKHLAMKARWQIAHMKEIGRQVIIFIDEPALAGFGSSAFISVTRELVRQLLDEVVDAIHQAGALAGIHVCANTDWLLAFHSAVDIINFDAYNYFDKFGLYQEAFLRYIDEGRLIAWGMVPTSDPALIAQETSRSLADRWLKQVEGLTSPEAPLEKILAHSLFTPSCGCGSLPQETAERVARLTRELGAIMQSHL